MDVQHVDIVCDRGIWHEHKAGHGKRRSVLARFVPEADPKKADIPGWRLIPKEPSGRTPGALARAEADRAKVPKEWGPIGFNEETGTIVNGLVPTVWIFPCSCGWPTYGLPNPEPLARLLDRTASKGRATLHVNALNEIAPRGAHLGHYSPAPSSEWETYARLSSTKSHVSIDPPNDFECLAEEDRDGRWLQVVCDGGERHAEWHRKHGARVIAGFMGEADENDWDDDEYRPSYAMLSPENDWPTWGVEEWPPTYVFHPCPCGREFPTMDQKKVHRVMEKLAMQRCHAVTVDTFLRSLALV